MGKKLRSVNLPLLCFLTADTLRTRPGTKTPETICAGTPQPGEVREERQLLWLHLLRKTSNSQIVALFPYARDARGHRRQTRTNTDASQFHRGSHSLRKGGQNSRLNSRPRYVITRMVEFLELWHQSTPNPRSIQQINITSAPLQPSPMSLRFSQALEA